MTSDNLKLNDKERWRIRQLALLLMDAGAADRETTGQSDTDDNSS